MAIIGILEIDIIVTVFRLWSALSWCNTPVWANLSRKLNVCVKAACFFIAVNIDVGLGSSGNFVKMNVPFAMRRATVKLIVSGGPVVAGAINFTFNSLLVGATVALNG